MKNYKIPIIIVLVLAVAGGAFATAAYMGVFNQTYKPKAGTALAKAGCGVCHVGNDFKKLNPYGTALKGKAANANSLKAVEKLDSDKDTFSNIDEIKAGTLPGDPSSKPAAGKTADSDPVCKMKVNPKTAKGGKSTYKGVTYYFCNAKCKAAFDKAPAKYVTAKSPAKP